MGHSPVIDESAYVAQEAHVSGRATIGAESSVWPFAVIRADIAPIRVGDRSNIQDAAVLHGATNHPVIIGDDVTIGHGAIVHGCTICDKALVGMGAIILNGARIGEGAIVGAGALVCENHVVEPHTVAFGSPARAVRPTTPADEAMLEENARAYVRLAGKARSATRAQADDHEADAGSR